MAIVPHYYRDWPNVMEWIDEAFKRADAADLERELMVRRTPHGYGWRILLTGRTSSILRTI